MPEQYIYEAHRISESLLPFIFHPEYVRVGPCSRINWHENIEFLFCLKGAGYIQLGMETCPFLPGDLLIVNADTLHTIGSQNSVSYQCLIVDHSFFLNNGIPITQLRFQNTVRDPKTAALFTAIAESYARLDMHSPYTIAEIRCNVLNFLLQLCRNYTTQANGMPAPTAPSIKETIVYIRNNISKPITLDQLAAHTGVSKYHLSRQFKLATGMTIIEYVNLTRCTEAKRLMEAGASVSAAALCCGYENLSYFSRTYKRLMGELPSAAAGKK